MDCPNPSTLVDILYIFAKLIAFGFVIAIVFIGMMFTVYRETIKERMKKIIDNE